MGISPHPHHSRYLCVVAASSLPLFALLILLTTPPVTRVTPFRVSNATATALPRTALAQGPAAQARLIKAYGNLPLSFEANRGQADSDVKFLSRGNGYTLLLTGNEAVLALQGGSQRSKVKNRRGSIVVARGSVASCNQPRATDRRQSHTPAAETGRSKPEGRDRRPRRAARQEQLLPWQ